MNKLQPSPLFNPPAATLRQPVAHWGALPPNPEDTRFFRSWLVYDSDLEFSRTSGRVNWNMVGGLALSLIVSVAGWTGIVLLISRLWK